MTSVASAINYLKLRASYGLVGSDETGLQAGASHFLYIDKYFSMGDICFPRDLQGDIDLPLALRL